MVLEWENVIIRHWNGKNESNMEESIIAMYQVFLNLNFGSSFQEPKNQSGHVKDIFIILNFKFVLLTDVYEDFQFNNLWLSDRINKIRSYV